jgi:hypothetical protein
MQEPRRSEPDLEEYPTALDADECLFTQWVFLLFVAGVSDAGPQHPHPEWSSGF